MRQDTGQQKLGERLGDECAPQVQVDDVVESTNVKVEKFFCLVAGRTGRPLSEAVGTELTQEDRSEPEANVFVNDLFRMRESETGRRRQCADAVCAEEIPSQFDSSNSTRMAVPAGPWTVCVVNEGRPVE